MRPKNLTNRFMVVMVNSCICNNYRRSAKWHVQKGRSDLKGSQILKEVPKVNNTFILFTLCDQTHDLWTTSDPVSLVRGVWRCTNLYVSLWQTNDILSLFPECTIAASSNTSFCTLHCRLGPIRMTMTSKVYTPAPIPLCERAWLRGW